MNRRIKREINEEYIGKEIGKLKGK